MTPSMVSVYVGVGGGAGVWRGGGEGACVRVGGGGLHVCRYRKGSWGVEVLVWGVWGVCDNSII